jgi:hypothetical protein
MDSSIKSLTITGTAAEDANKSRRSTGSRKKRQSKQEEDEDFLEQAKQMSYSKAQPEPVIQQQNKQASHKQESIHVATPSKQSQPVIHISTTKVDPPQITPTVALLPKKVEETREDPQYDGGAKVILKPAKNPRVKLQPKATHASSRLEPQTRKARRIRLSVGSLAHRFTRAKRVKDDMEKKSITTIRDYLIQKGVIQDKSKAPERMLRSMYKDFMLLKDTAL